MRAIWRVLGKFISWISRNKFFIPEGAVGTFVIIVFFYNLITKGPLIAFTRIAKQIFASEWIINQNVNLAIANAPNYGLINLVDIIFALMTLYVVIKFIGKTLIGITGSQAQTMAYVFGAIITFILEFSAVSFIDGQLGFLPLRDGVFWLAVNIQPVITNAVPHFITSLFSLF